MFEPFIAHKKARVTAYSRGMEGSNKFVLQGSIRTNPESSLVEDESVLEIKMRHAAGRKC